MILYKFEFYVPESHLGKVKEAVFAAGAGRIGAYDHTCWQTLGTGEFRPLEGSNPYQGKTGAVEKVIEYKVEMVCAKKHLDAAIEALKKTHPYETPAFSYWKLSYRVLKI